MLYLASPANLPSLAPNEATDISLNLLPAEDALFGELTGSLTVASDLAHVNVGFRFVVVSNQSSDLTVFVEDEV
jgi:uncharacterized membrane protein